MDFQAIPAQAGRRLAAVSSFGSSAAKSSGQSNFNTTPWFSSSARVKTCEQRSQSQKCSTPEIPRSEGAPLPVDCEATDSGRKRKNLPPASQRKAVGQAGFAHFGCNF